MQSLATDPRLIRLNIDEALLADADRTGEKARFSMAVGGHEVLTRFPTYGLWDDYAQKTGRLMILLSQGVGSSLSVDLNSMDTQTFVLYMELLGTVLRWKTCRDAVEEIFFTHLRPIVVGLEFPPTPKFKPRRGDPFWTADDAAMEFQARFVRVWMSRRMDFSHLFAMFQSILLVDEWLKKKAQRMEGRLRQAMTPSPAPSLIPTSPESSESGPLSSASIQPFSFA